MINRRRGKNLHFKLKLLSNHEVTEVPEKAVWVQQRSSISAEKTEAEKVLEITVLVDF